MFESQKRAMESPVRIIDIDTNAEEKELEAKALVIQPQAQNIVIASNVDMQRAQEFIEAIKAAIKRTDDLYQPMAKKAHESHKFITTNWSNAKKPFVEAMDIVIKKVRDYITEEKRKAEAEEARLREIARRLEEERILAEAEELEKEGRTAEAEEIISAPIQVVTPVVKADVPRYDARTYKAPIPKARVINKAKFVAWVAASPDRLDMVIENERALNAKAKSLGKILNIPGVEYYEI